MIEFLPATIFLGALLFAVGWIVLITRRNLIMMLIGLELMLNAANLNLVAFNHLGPPRLDGQMFALFVILIAVCEAAVGIALVLRVYQFYKTSVPDSIRDLKEN
ncbi:MAG: NADH-quinone oxidoreductase subunit NuoK [Bacteroidota bacterium]